MAKKKIKKTIPRYKSGRVFIKTSNTGLIREEKGRAVTEEFITTYRVTKKKNKFIIYELPRKKNAIRRKTIKQSKKYKNLYDVQEGVTNNKIRINSKLDDTVIYKNPDSKTTMTITQTNYVRRIKTPFAQVVGLVEIEDTNNGLIDHFVGYSRTIAGIVTDAKLSIADKQIIEMAESKFLAFYSSDVSLRDLYEGEWEYAKPPARKHLKSEILQRRFIYRNVRTKKS